MTFKEAIRAKLYASPGVTALVEGRIYPGVLPLRYDIGRDGPALTYFVADRPQGHHLVGSDGTATARVQFSAWSYTEAVADSIAEALRNLLDGPPGVWGDGTVEVMSCVQQDEVDLFGQPKSGTDQWIYQIAVDYSIKHRVSIPTGV